MGELLLSPAYGLSKNQLKKTTSTVADVISGKKFYDANGNLATGTLVDLGSEPEAKGGTMYNGGLYFYIGEDSGQSRWALTRGCYMPQAKVASIIGLSADKIMAGNTILGIGGTGGNNFNASNSQNKNGGQVELRRDEGNHVAYGHTVCNITCQVTGRSIHVYGQAYFHVDNNGTSGVIGDGNHSTAWIDFWVGF